METKETKKCPYCGEEILAVAKKCKHCREWLPEPKKMVPCPICGEDIEEGTKICPHCKEKLEDQVEPKNDEHIKAVSTLANSTQGDTYDNSNDYQLKLWLMCQDGA